MTSYSTRTEQEPGTTPHPETVPRAAVSFPTDFAWGAATAAYQIEGATTTDGRGASIWDTFSARPGTVAGGDTGDVAVEHYHRSPEDVALLQHLGIGHYRFSIAWPRIQPHGSGQANPRGLDFYDQLVDRLLAAGIQPWPTLYHWDLPQPLEDAGGWPHRDTAYRFAEYAAMVAQRLGDRVGHWWTVNEPWCVANLGYATGEHAPGRREPAAALAATHHLLLAHGLAAHELRRTEYQGTAPAVGIALNLQPLRPHTSTVTDLDAVRRIDGVRNRIFLEPLQHASYPPDVRADLAELSDFAFVQPGDMATVAAPLDFLGINYYSPARVAAQPAAQTERPPSLPLGYAGVRFIPEDVPRTDQDWEVDAGGLTDLLTRVAADCPDMPLYVTENGASYRDKVTEDGAVHDQERLEYLDTHVRAVHAALAAGAPIHGYFVWSLLDNFEWAYGYRERFGIIHVDFATQRRRIKDSGHWYGALACTGTVPAEPT